MACLPPSKKPPPVRASTIGHSPVPEVDGYHVLICQRPSYPAQPQWPLLIVPQLPEAALLSSASPLPSGIMPCCADTKPLVLKEQVGANREIPQIAAEYMGTQRKK